MCSTKVPNTRRSSGDSTKSLSTTILLVSIGSSGSKQVEENVVHAPLGIGQRLVYRLLPRGCRFHLFRDDLLDQELALHARRQRRGRIDELGQFRAMRERAPAYAFDHGAIG